MKKGSITGQLCILLLIFITPGYGQTDGRLMFHGAIRDKAGNLWFATTGAGVYRYDGISGKFTNFTMRDGLPSDNVSSILEDRAGNFWFSTESGVCRYDGKSFTGFSTKESGCPFDSGLLLEDRKGNFWFGTNGYGICRYNPVTGVSANFTKEDGLGSNTVQCMLEDKAGNLWVGERAGGVCRYDSAAGRFTKVNGECFSSQIMGILEDKNGNIWFANLYDGLCRYEPGSGRFTHFTQADGLCHNFVTCIYEDKKGNLWFGSDAGKWNTGGGGLCGYDGKSFIRFTSKDGLTKFDVWTIVEDNDGNIWVGTKGGLYRYHSPSGRFIDYTHKVNSGSN
jgi:ligand-binding sensor domain-containing protein